jgi:electron transfer flavoprotein beta subunit
VKIAVCVKVIAEEPRWLRMDPRTLRIYRDGPGALNPPDRHAVEEALRLREVLAGGEVLVVSMAPSEAVEEVREALLMGADRALVVADEAASGSDLLATSRVLAQALRQEQADLILFGQQGEDSNGSLLWAAVAERLDLPLISGALRIELADGWVRARRRSELGCDLMQAPLPCVVAVSSAINEPRHPTFREMRAAAAKTCVVLSVADLGLSAGDVGEAGSRTVVYGLGDPPPRGERKVIEDDGHAAEAILEYLAARRLI